jgi:hypothetical protein
MTNEINQLIDKNIIKVILKDYIEESRNIIAKKTKEMLSLVYSMKDESEQKILKRK